MPYEQAWELQNFLAEQVASGTRPATLLLLEHPHTYTFGRRGQQENLRWSTEELSRRNIAIHWVDRGGNVTYHGPGQLVGYPLLSLMPGGLRQNNLGQSDPRQVPRADYIGYLRNLEQMLIRALAYLDVPAQQMPGLTGVWVQADDTSPPQDRPDHLRQHPAKIAAIGVKVDARGVSRHGFALNVNPDMSYWEGIIACGLADYPVISLADILIPAPSMQQVIQAVISAFGETFDFAMIEKDFMLDSSD